MYIVQFTYGWKIRNEQGITIPSNSFSERITWYANIFKALLSKSYISNNNLFNALFVTEHTNKQIRTHTPKHALKVTMNGET